MSANISDAIDTLNSTIAKVASFGLLLMTLITFAIVVFRYGFDTGWIALQESVMYLHGFVFMLGAAYTLREDGHVRVDIFYRKFSERSKALVNILGTLLLLMPVCVFVFTVSWSYVSNSWQLLEASKEAGGLPLVFLLKSLIPAFSLLLFLQGLADVIRNIVFIQEEALE